MALGNTSGKEGDPKFGEYLRRRQGEKDAGRNDTRTLVFNNWDGLNKITYFKDGKYLEEGLKALDYAFRDKRDGVARAHNPKFYDTIGRFLNNLNGKIPTLTSSLRTQRTHDKLTAMGYPTRSDSNHVSGVASDWVGLPESTLLKAARKAMEGIPDQGDTTYHAGHLHFAPQFPKRAGDYTPDARFIASLKTPQGGLAFNPDIAAPSVASLEPKPENTIPAPTHGPRVWQFKLDANA